MRTCTMSDSDSLTTFARNHPKMIGVLFALMFMLTQAGTAAAGAHIVVSGP